MMMTRYGNDWNGGIIRLVCKMNLDTGPITYWARPREGSRKVVGLVARALGVLATEELATRRAVRHPISRTANALAMINRHAHATENIKSSRTLPGVLGSPIGISVSVSTAVVCFPGS